MLTGIGNQSKHFTFNLPPFSQMAWAEEVDKGGTLSLARQTSLPSVSSPSRHHHRPFIATRGSPLPPRTIFVVCRSSAVTNAVTGRFSPPDPPPTRILSLYRNLLPPANLDTTLPRAPPSTTAALQSAASYHIRRRGRFLTVARDLPTSRRPVDPVSRGCYTVVSYLSQPGERSPPYLLPRVDVTSG